MLTLKEHLRLERIEVEPRRSSVDKEVATYEKPPTLGLWWKAIYGRMNRFIWQFPLWASGRVCDSG